MRVGANDAAARDAATDHADGETKPVATATVDYRCNQCGAPVTAEPGADSLTCGHCGHRQPIEQREGRVIEYDFESARRSAPRGSAADLTKGGREVGCKGCGARTVLTGQSAACPFCGSPLVADLPTSEAAILPESLLPHRVTREEARTGFQAWLKSRWFAPNDLARRAKTSGLDGVFLPYWTYDSQTTTSYTGLRGTYYYVTVSYTDSKGNSRTRTERRIRWTPTSGRVLVPFDDVLVCASKSLPIKLIEDLEPWDLPALQPFEPAYLAGFVTERYQLDLEQGFDRADERMRPKIKSVIRADIGGDVQQILSMNVTHRNVKFKHLLLPLWISSFRYGERVFRVVVNARTGEVQGERPWSWVKILLLTLFILALVGGGIWLYTSSQRASHERDYDRTPAQMPTPIDNLPLDPPILMPTPPPPPPRPVIDPLAALPSARATARAQLREAALTSLTIAQVDDDGTARGEATFAYRALSARRGQPCAGTVTLDEQGARWQAEDDPASCAARLVVPPACPLTEIMTRARALTSPSSPDLGLAGVTLVTYQAEAEAEAPEPGTRGASRAAGGAWTVLRGTGQVTIADDCAPPPAPRPLRRRR